MRSTFLFLMMSFVLMCVISCNDLFMGSDAKTAMPTDVRPVAVSHVSDGGLCRKWYSGRWSRCCTSRIAVTLVKQEV